MDNYISVDYNELKGNLSTCPAVVLFRKKTGQLRTMLCTRDKDIVVRLLGVDVTTQLHGHDKRHTEEKRVLSVIDLVKEEARAIGTDRIIGITYLPQPYGDDAVNQIYDYYNQVVEYARQCTENEEKRAEQQLQKLVTGGDGSCI